MATKLESAEITLIRCGQHLMFERAHERNASEREVLLSACETIWERKRQLREELKTSRSRKVEANVKR